MPRSLLDAADLPRVRAAADERGGPAAVLVAYLLDGGVVAHAPDDPDWSDRDRVVVGSRDLAAAVALVPDAPAVLALDGGRALALAAGLAVASVLDGGVVRVFCLLDARALDDGAAWEAVQVRNRGPLTASLLLREAEVPRAQQLFRAGGWRAERASASDPVEVLGALDRVHREGAEGAGAVLAVHP